MLFPPCFFFGVFLVGSTARSVNVTDVWFLPEVTFPVFYRFFKEKMTWNEAKAACGLYHADILSVETIGQSDAARAYLKEMDVTDNVWIGLKKNKKQNFFLWSNGEKVSGDGYWAGPIPKIEDTLCVAMDPLSDFRWIPFLCEGPQVAPFVCELMDCNFSRLLIKFVILCWLLLAEHRMKCSPTEDAVSLIRRQNIWDVLQQVPDWIKKEDGCLITSLPSLTVTFLPETGVVQLLSDCGSEGTRRTACKGGIDREELIERVSCELDVVNQTFGKSTIDAKEKQGARNKSENSGLSDSIYSKLTRHKRHCSPSSPSF